MSNKIVTNIAKTTSKQEKISFQEKVLNDCNCAILLVFGFSYFTGTVPALGTEKGSRRNSRTFFISGIYFATDAILSENFESFKMI